MHGWQKGGMAAKGTPKGTTKGTAGVHEPSGQPPQIFDRALLIGRKLRALGQMQRAAKPDPGFLLERVARDLRERLDAVERHFASALDLSDDDGRTRRLLEQSPRIGSIGRMASDPAFLAAQETGCLVGVPDNLALAPASLDLVTSALALQWVNDLPGALVQLRRALRPDGLFLGALIGGNTLHELREVMASVEEAATGGISPHVAPFVDVRDFGALLQRAGFALPVSDVDSFTVRYDHFFALVEDLRAMGATNVLAARSRKPWTRRMALQAAQLYAQRFCDDDGRIRASFQVISFSGWAPAESQQKPLKPGSANTRLAEALGTREFPARSR